MSIRFAAEKDVAALSRMYEDFYACNASQQPQYYCAAKESGAYPEQIIHSRTSVLLVSEDSDTKKLTGFLHLEEQRTPPYASIIPHRFAEIVDLYVSPAFRRKGIATVLLQEAKKIASGRNLDYLELFVLSESEGARLLYSRENFQIVSHNMKCPL